MSEYRIKINKRGRYYIVKRSLIFNIIPSWDRVGEYSYGGHFPLYFDEKENAITKVIELTKRDELKAIEDKEIQKKIKKFKVINISSEDIREKFPQHFL